MGTCIFHFNKKTSNKFCTSVESLEINDKKPVNQIQETSNSNETKKLTIHGIDKKHLFPIEIPLDAIEDLKIVKEVKKERKNSKIETVEKISYDDNVDQIINHIILGSVKISNEYEVKKLDEIEIDYFSKMDLNAGDSNEILYKTLNNYKRDNSIAESLQHSMMSKTLFGAQKMELEFVSSQNLSDNSNEEVDEKQKLRHKKSLFNISNSEQSSPIKKKGGVFKLT